MNKWLWLDANGNPHVDIPEALKEEGLADTPENRAALTECVDQLCEQMSLEHRHRPNPANYGN